MTLTPARPTTAEILALAATSPTTDVPTAAAVLGMGANLGYQLAAAGQFPVRILRLGRKLRVPTADLLAALGLSSVPQREVPSRELSQAPKQTPNAR